MILVTMSYGNNFLNTRLAENEFSTNKQFMQTTGLQLDDIAWTTGRTQTISYSSKFGSLKFQELALNYTIQLHTSSGWEIITANGETGMVLFNMPASSYTVANNYFERVPFSASSSFLQSGSSAPVSQVFCEEKLPMTDGSYTRIAIVPTIRMLNSTISGTQQNPTSYFKFYLPTLENGTSRYLSQSVTLTGDGITKITRSGVDQVRIDVSFPQASHGFDSSFFNFNSTTLTLSNITNPAILPNSVVEFYFGKVMVTIGQV
jgi:hypothetical protein